MDTTNESNSQAILKAILNILPDLKFRINKDGIFLNFYASRHEQDALMAPPEEFLGKHVADILPAYLSAGLVHKIETAISKGTLETMEYPLHIQGHLKFFEARICAINEEEVFVIVRNITEVKTTRKELEQKVQELNQKNAELEKFTSSNLQLENFAHTVSHDLREPVRTMKSFSQLLKRRYADDLDADAHEYLDFIASAANHMNKLITDLLEYSTVTENNGNHPIESLDAEELIQGVITNLSDSVEKSGAEIFIKTDLPEIKGSYTNLSQLFQNLISNAIKFYKSDTIPKVEISVAEKTNHWQFQIKDNGIGIPQKDLDNIFVLFRRLHSKRIYPGSGIGLSLSKQIVEQHGGQIWAESEEGLGTTFFFTLNKSGKAEFGSGNLESGSRK